MYLPEQAAEQLKSWPAVTVVVVEAAVGVVVAVSVAVTAAG